MPPVEVLHATDGQDRGARFGLLGTEATIGRGPVMDMVLTDPRVSRRHAVLRLEDGRLTIEDLGSTSGTEVNGRAISGPTTLAVGDRIRLGHTELTVVWTPGAPTPAPPVTEPAPAAAVPAPAAAVPPPPPVAPAPAGAIEIRAGGGRTVRRVGWGGVLALCALVAAGLALLALALPALRRGDVRVSFWDIGITSLQVLAACTAVGGVALTAAWLACELDPARARGRAPLAAAACVWGGLIAGTPLFVAAATTPGHAAASGLTAMIVAGLGLAAAGVARLTLHAGPPRGPRSPRPGGPELLCAAGGLGGVCLAASGPLTWVSRGGLSLNGFDEAIGAGRWAVPLGLALTAACALAATVGGIVDRRTTLPMAGAAAGLAGAGLTFGIAATVALSGDMAGAGLTLALAGGALAAVTTAAAVMALTAADATDRQRSPQAPALQ